MSNYDQHSDEFTQENTQINAASDIAGISTVLFILLAHLREQKVLNESILAAMIERAEVTSMRETPLLAGAPITIHVLAWLKANAV